MSLCGLIWVGSIHWSTNSTVRGNRGLSAPVEAHGMIASYCELLRAIASYCELLRSAVAPRAVRRLVRGVADHPAKSNRRLFRLRIARAQSPGGCLLLMLVYYIPTSVLRHVSGLSEGSRQSRRAAASYELLRARAVVSSLQPQQLQRSHCAWLCVALRQPRPPPPLRARALRFLRRGAGPGTGLYTGSH